MRASGPLVDNRRGVEFFTCAEHGTDTPSHFVITDDPCTYHLIGCAENGRPRWAEVRWKRRVFPLDCELRAW